MNVCSHKVLVVATSKKTRGGITAVIKAHETGPQWKEFHCHWIQTHRDGNNFIKLAYLLRAWVEYLALLPFYDLVHIHFSLRTTARRKKPFVMLARLMGKKVVIHLHCGNQIDDIWNSDYDYLFSHADACLLLSENLKHRVESHTGASDRYSVLYNPCPVVSPDPVLPKKKTILFSGTLYEGKGYRDLIMAFGRICRKYPDWRLVLAGNGEVETGRRIAAECGASDQVDFLGWVRGDQKDTAFREASIFCLPSYAEGFPMAVLDAWAYGLPVVTTPVGGIPDVAVDGENILLFNPGDVDKLAEQLERMINDTQLRSRIGKASAEFADGKFNVATVNRELALLYSRLLSSGE